MSDNKIPSFLPPGFGTARLSMLKDWKNERAQHSHAKYFVHRAEVFNKTVDFSSNKLATCYFCGFPDHTFLELHHLDNDHSNYDEDNLVLACSCCHKLHHLGWVATENLGKLTFIPTSLIPGSEINPNLQSSDKNTNTPTTHGSGILEMLNLFGYYKIAQSLNTRNSHQNSLSSYTLGNLFSETRVLVGSSGLANNYANQLMYERKKALIHKKRQELNASGDEQGGADGQSDDKTAAAASAMAAHDAVDSERLNHEIAELEKDLSTLEKRINEASSLKQLEDMSSRFKNEMFSDFQSYAASSLHLLDILEALDELDARDIERKSTGGTEKESTVNDSNKTEDKTPTALFFEKHNEALNKHSGVFTIEFNPSILEPWHKALNYTLEDRLNFYIYELGIGTAKGYKTSEKENALFVPGIDQIVERFINRK